MEPRILPSGPTPEKWGVLGMCGPRVPASPVFRFWKYFDMHGTPRAPWSPRSSRNKTVTPGQFGELNIKIVRRENVPCLAFPQLITISARCLSTPRFVPCFPGLCSSQGVDLSRCNSRAQSESRGAWLRASIRWPDRFPSLKIVRADWNFTMSLKVVSVRRGAEIEQFS
jgi:hypothetical protein